MSDSEAPPDDRHVWEYTAVQDVFWLAAVGGLIVLGFVLRAVVIPILLAFGLAYVLNPVVKLLQRAGLGRFWATLVVIVTLVTAAVGSAAVAVPFIADEGAQLLGQLPTYAEKAKEAVGSVYWPTWIDDAVARLKDSPPDSKAVTGAIGRGLLYGLGTVSTAFGVAAYVASCCVIVPILTFFFSWNLDDWLASGRELIPAPHRGEAVELLTKMDESIGGFIRGRLLAMVFLCVTLSVGWALVGVPYAVGLGVAAGLLGAAPLLSYFVWPIAVAVAYGEAVATEGGVDWMAVALWPSVVFHAIQLIENYVITPYVQSEAMEMSATTVLIVLFAGGLIGGVYGILLALPAAGCLKVLLVESVLPRWRAWAEGT